MERFSRFRRFELMSFSVLRQGQVGGSINRYVRGRGLFFSVRNLIEILLRCFRNSATTTGAFLHKGVRIQARLNRYFRLTVTNWVSAWYAKCFFRNFSLDESSSAKGKRAHE